MNDFALKTGFGIKRIECIKGTRHRFFQPYTLIIESSLRFNKPEFFYCVHSNNIKYAAETKIDLSFAKRESVNDDP